VTRASACGKAILLGEHAVVYGRPAIAVPVSDVRAQADVSEAPDWEITAADLDRRFSGPELQEDPVARPLWETVQNVLAHLGLERDQVPLRVVVQSAVPIARGMGSGTAVATALVRALAQHYGRLLDAETVSQLVYRTEVLLHGSPSGVDNAVVAYERPVFFISGAPPMPFAVGRELDLLVADSGVAASTRSAVGQVRADWQRDPARSEALFDRIGALAEAGREAIGAGEAPALGALMAENHALLAELGVSNAKLDLLVGAARDAGAWGAKLSGGGLGGCLVALVSKERREPVTARLLEAGAAAVYPTVLRQSAFHAV
jgi:mevalonate kinase